MSIIVEKLQALNIFWGALGYRPLSPPPLIRLWLFKSIVIYLYVDRQWLYQYDMKVVVHIGQEMSTTKNIKSGGLL